MRKRNSNNFLLSMSNACGITMDRYACSNVVLMSELPLKLIYLIAFCNYSSNYDVFDFKSEVAVV